MLMENHDKKSLIERYIRAYNSFDVDGMVALLHPECSFQNISGGQINASAAGISQFRELAEKSKSLFSSRNQTITSYQSKAEIVTVDIDYEGVLRADLPNRLKAGEKIRLKGKSVFKFRDGLIYQLTDYS
jgi:ketosteroid isomerase-like protein